MNVLIAVSAIATQTDTRFVFKLYTPQTLFQVFHLKPTQDLYLNEDGRKWHKENFAQTDTRFVFKHQRIFKRSNGKRTQTDTRFVFKQAEQKEALAKINLKPTQDLYLNSLQCRPF